jgi:hypothetical protein
MIVPAPTAQGDLPQDKFRARHDQINILPAASLQSLREPS